MDALTRRQFDRAMFAKNRTLAIRVGDYASRDIKEASFEYGYIKGDTYKPGGTCAGSGKITFTSIITTFNKLDTLHPEIGLLVGDTYQWVKMGEYFINDIEIDRNRNTTTLELMDGMFKLNREYVTNLHFPAEVREVIQEICLKTGIELANDYFGISAMRYHVEQVPEGKKLSFRDMLSSMTQMIGMSCFFNREGKMEIRDLTESNITINADSYFLHGLTKSEIEYQIAGITCKTDKKPLTVGMKTGRSLELDNVFMTQSALNDLYYKLKNLTYYPYNLNYQGHLLLEVGQWVTIQTNKKETFKVPVLSQSFTFKGGLRGRISADSKAGNDTQYSYEGTITKQIKQQDGIEAKIQAQIEAADKDFDQKVDKIKKDFNDQVELAKAKAEEVKQELSDTINQRFDSFDNASIQEARRKAEEALRSAGASSSLAQEAKRIGLDSVAKLEEFKRKATNAQTALSVDLDALKRTIANDIRPKQVQSEAEIAKQVEELSRTKNELAGVKSAQATYEKTTTRRLSELTNLANGKASKSELTQTAEELSSKIASVQAAHKNQGDRVSVIESNFKQRADALEVGVRSLTEGLRTKADISSLNVTAENIRQSVKRLETNTQDKLNQKLSQAEFEVRAGSIRQEILNATKDKADKTLVIAEAGKLREEFSKMKVGSRNYAEDYDFSRGLWLYSQGDNSPQDWTISNGEYNVKGTTNTWKQMQIHSKEGSRSSWKSSTALLDLELGETYTLSFQGICYSGNPSVWVSLRANRTVSGNTEVISSRFTLTSSWQTYQVTIPALTKPDNFDFWRIILGYDEIGHVAFRKVELTRSSTRIDAGPAPEDGKTDLVVAKSEFQKTAEGLSAKMTAVERYVNQDGQRQESLQRYAREESAKQATSVRELVTRDFVGKSAYQEDVRGLERRFNAISTQTNNDITSKIAQYKQTVDGRFADITSLISGKANQTDFQQVRETSRLYERILGNTEQGLPDKISRLVMSNEIFQTEVSKYVTDDNNLIVNSMTMDKHSLVNANRSGVNVSVADGVFTVRAQGLAGYNWSGFTLPIYVKKIYRGETYTLGFKYRIKEYPDSTFAFNVKNHGLNKILLNADIGKNRPPLNEWQELQKSFTVQEDFAFGEDVNYPFYIYLAKNGWIEFKEPILVRGSNTGPYKPSQFDDAYKLTEATRTQVTQLAGSYAIRNLNSAGDLISGINLGANGHNRFDGKLTHITGETLIDKAVIKSAMVDKLKTANFEAGSVTTTILDAEAVTAEKVRFDDAFIRKMIANEAFIDQLTSKQIFTTKVESVISSSTFLEAYQGKIGGFTLGQFDQGGGHWISGANEFAVGMGNGEGRGTRTAFWANWGDSWNTIGDRAWYVNTDGKMYCKNDSIFYRQVTFDTNCYIDCYGTQTFYKSPIFVHGIELGSADIYGDGSNPRGGKNTVVWWNQVGSGSVKYWGDKSSDRRLKENITATAVKALDKINRLNMVAFDFIESKKHEEIGLIAQEAETIVPEVISRDPENPDGYLHIDYTAFVPYLIKAIQELNQKINLMEERYGSII